MDIKNTSVTDLDEILKIYEYAREKMRQTGNPNQWKDSSPLKEDIIFDINNLDHYIIIEDNKIVGIFTLLKNPDPTYSYIEGKWLNEEKYVTIHKIASAPNAHDILRKSVDYAFRFSNNVRNDTHEDNKIMRHLLDKLGFSYCGIIYLKNGEPRRAYQKHK